VFSKDKVEKSSSRPLQVCRRCPLGVGVFGRFEGMEVDKWVQPQPTADLLQTAAEWV
jgi:hypothetical protein